MKSSKNAIMSFSLLVVMSLSSGMLYGKSCPDKAVPNTLNAVYVKYKITDELELKNQKTTGAPSSVRGDELAELVIWKDYRWERLFGKYWYIDDDAYQKFMDSYTKKMDGYLQKQAQGIDVSASVEVLSIQMLNFKPKHKTYEYDRISVKTPKYSLEYNRTNKMGYGYYGVNPSVSNRSQLNPNVKSQLDAFITSSFRSSNQILGINKVSSSQSSVLGIACKREIINTSFKDFERDYGQIESCVARINGHDVDLYTKMGNPGERYIMQATEIKKSHKVKKNLFCNPSYVTVN